MENIYDLKPVDGRKSFYGKATVTIADDGSQTLYSYHTPIVRKDSDGSLHRLYDGWSTTTGRHIYAFCGMHKKEFEALPLQ
ncbi:MAG: hypothetical protein PUF17_08150 [Lactimicrobium massiliense]|nr:hypothetical protein [Lactimicrobium massiliense]MDD6560927.1 hypothetical protein [Lactimicrobium massiliense]